MLDAGDVAWAELDPVLGTEQAGRRPVLVLTSHRYHAASRRCLICPISSRHREWPFNVRLPDTMRMRGDVLVDQVRMIDRTQRLFDLIETAPAALLADVRGRLAALVGIDLAAIARDGGITP